MNRLTYWRMLITICGLLVLGCEKETLPTEASINYKESKKGIQKTEIFHENFHEPIEFTEFIDCAGEEVHFTGSLHTNVHFVLDANGGFHFGITLNDHSFGGVGLTTGTKYHEVGATVQANNGKDEATQEFTFTITFDIIGQGPGNNFIFKQKV